MKLELTLPREMENCKPDANTTPEVLMTKSPPPQEGNNGHESCEGLTGKRIPAG